jgi:hypothetical protein
MVYVVCEQVSPSGDSPDPPFWDLVRRCLSASWVCAAGRCGFPVAGRGADAPQSCKPRWRVVAEKPRGIVAPLRLAPLPRGAAGNSVFARALDDIHIVDKARRSQHRGAQHD